ncbi:MAG: hypothetical protein R3313_03525 [Candidatus Saccharimonadales bacterium]|nr:hypothetical protein [Candidatus Saccharimonadales bacterium]
MKPDLRKTTDLGTVVVHSWIGLVLLVCGGMATMFSIGSDNSGVGHLLWGYAFKAMAGIGLVWLLYAFVLGWIKHKEARLHNRELRRQGLWP